ncbi:MAG: MBL fold metallo-hydrolase [Betaproteobacteria bacterium]|nr:MBL fold metallo-hydrolase [Betaproteobacteria bacterium]
MVRPHLQLHPTRPPATPLPAATVLLLRDGPQGLEVLMTRRSMNASFAPGAYVFPGGGIDAADAQVHHLAARRAGQDSTRLTQAVAAIRESFEELGVLLATDPSGRMVTMQDIERLDRSLSLFEQCEAAGLTLAADQVFVLAHWITDRDLSKRFDVPFLVARMPEGQTPVADEQEQFEPIWISPAEALRRHREDDFFIIFPTIRTLERMQTHATVESVLHACASEQPWFTSCPRAGWLGGKEARYMEHDAPFGELALTSRDGQIVHHLDWQCETPVRFLQHVQRLTAPNPSMMTGPGTNSYVVGDARSGFIVIDPGPPDAQHVERLWHITGGDIRWIVCTHSHPDHAPGAALLKALCAQHGLDVAVLGMASLATARAHSRFMPDRELHDGERLVLRSDTDSHSLRVVHTPGHAANHVCLILEEDGLLFTGDHVLNGSTTVIDPPDGDMGDYLASLDKLMALSAEFQVEFILPAHGHVLGNVWGEPYGAIDCMQRLKAHRLAREAKVIQAMKAMPQGNMADWLRLVYDDVPEAVWPVAMRSLEAHVARLIRQQDAQAEADE